jgi:hypothetical protein
MRITAPAISRGELADLEQLKAKRFDLSQDAIERRPVQHAGQDGL